MTFDLMRYWDGQPVHFVCGSRQSKIEQDSGPPMQDIFWCITIEVLQDEEDEDSDTDEDQSSDDID